MMNGNLRGTRNFIDGIYKFLVNHKFVVALLAPIFILLGLSVIELQISGNQDCQPKVEQEQLSWLSCQITKLKLVDSIESYSILVVAILFVLEAEERKQQSHRQAWQIIDGSKNIETSYARFHALEDLNRDEVPLNGLDAVGADLAGIKLEGAKLVEACLKGAKLQNAKFRKAQLESADLKKVNLQEADLQEANLRLANLEKADLKKAYLQEADLSGANLKQASLGKADLRGADLRGADLRSANFRGANLEKTNLEDANIAHANFQGVQNLTLDQVQLADNWKEAIFDNTVCSDPSLNQVETAGIGQASAQASTVENIVGNSYDSTNLQFFVLLARCLVAKELEQLMEQANEVSNLSNEKLLSRLKANSFSLPEIKDIEALIAREDVLDESRKAELERLIADIEDDFAQLEQLEDSAMSTPNVET